MSIPPPNQPAGTPTPAPFCARCGAPNEAGLAQCPHCGQSLLAAAWLPQPGGYPPQGYVPPGYPPQGYPPQPAGSGALDALIPTKNPAALTAYYLGVFSIVPCLAIPMGIAAVVLGVRGLRLFKEHPEVRGKAHAWVGIIAGGLFALLNIAAIGFALISASLHPSG